MDLIEKLKVRSSKWIKSKGPSYENFYWQRGYGCFSVNPNQMGAVQKYILNQEAHHKKASFQEEYRGFLEKYRISYDDRYVWD